MLYFNTILETLDELLVLVERQTSTGGTQGLCGIRMEGPEAELGDVRVFLDVLILARLALAVASGSGLVEILAARVHFRRGRRLFGGYLRLQSTDLLLVLGYG